MPVTMHYALIDDHADIGSTARVYGQAIVRGNTRIQAGGVFGGEILLDGDLNINQDIVLTDNVEYRAQDDLPWCLTFASPDDPEYNERLQKAVEIDPAFHRIMGAFGAHTSEHRAIALQKLLSESDESRAAVHRIVRTVGGTFTKEGYNPRSTAEIQHYLAALNELALVSENFTGYRVLDVLDIKPAVEKDDGTVLYSGAMKVITSKQDGEPARTLFQPIIYEESQPDHPTLIPAIGNIHTVSEVYEEPMDAQQRAYEALHWEAPITFMGTALPCADYQKLGIDNLPVIRDTKSRNDPLQLAMQRTRPSSLDGDDLPGSNAGPLMETTQFAAIEVPLMPDKPMDLARVTAQIVQFHDTPEQAYRNMVSAYASKEDFLRRIPQEIKEREDRIAELTNQLWTDSNDDLICELAELDPPNVAILAEVYDMPTQNVDDKTTEVSNLPAVFRKRSSTGTSYFAGTVTIRDHDYHTSLAMQESYPDIEAAKIAAFAFTEEQQTRFAGTEITQEPNPPSSSTSTTLSMNG